MNLSSRISEFGPIVSRVSSRKRTWIEPPCAVRMRSSCSSASLIVKVRTTVPRVKSAAGTTDAALPTDSARAISAPPQQISTAPRTHRPQLRKRMNPPPVCRDDSGFPHIREAHGGVRQGVAGSVSGRCLSVAPNGRGNHVRYCPLIGVKQAQCGIPPRLNLIPSPSATIAMRNVGAGGKMRKLAGAPARDIPA